MVEPSYKLFYDYLINKDITVLLEPRKVELDIKDIDEEKVKKQLELISLFHKKVMGYYERGSKLNDSTGKVFEKYKMYEKKLKKDIRNNRYSGVIKEILKATYERVNQSINKIYDIGYLNIIRRSMEREEICLEDSSFNNIFLDKKIIIRDVNSCSYNNLEMDAVYLLGKLKRKRIDLNYRALAEYFCSLEGLGIESVDYIIAFISYPYQTVKCLNRYRDNRAFISEEEFIKKLKKAVRKDGESLI